MTRMARTPRRLLEQLGGGDALEDMPERAPRQHRRQYKIQEVIKRRQIILVQVVKEERGNKGAALTTYLSLAGRYSVLMPNTGKGGGISRKITNAEDRKRLKEVAQELEVPEGMGIILRTAGASRTKAEIKRDYEYLMRLWESVRELTLALRRAVRWSMRKATSSSARSATSTTRTSTRFIVAGDEAYREAKDFMRMLMPSHAKSVKPYREPEPLFAALRRRAPARRDVLQHGHAALGRLHRHQPDRGAGRDRRQLRRARPASTISRTPPSRPISKRPRKSPASCACATWPASS